VQGEAAAEPEPVIVDQPIVDQIPAPAAIQQAGLVSVNRPIRQGSAM
jgi:hypothetical protein